MKQWILLSLVLVLFWQCNRRIVDNDNQSPPDSTVLVTKEGQADRLEIATWNIENFPKAGNQTINDVAQIIKDLDIDLIGVQEIASVRSFNELLNQLDGWQGVLSNDTYGNGNYQKTAILYKTDFISISAVKNIFENDGYAFPRPPLEAYVQIKDLEGVKFDFNMIVLHLKASGGSENEARRKEAIKDLTQYIKSEIAQGADPDFVVLGDWNDALTDTGSTNVFLPMLNDPQTFMFLTAKLTNQFSYISNTFKSLIDHIMITADAQTEYGQGECKVLYLDRQYLSYPNNVSDHRPVMACFKGFRLKLNPN
ncbi:MAG: endonuclease/exonuclease/phosphatase family protein [Caldisericaceae bacterium]|nr:endonuclease/exonuclease/phosphatase family protein [Caldisericaceae bacterium]